MGAAGNKQPKKKGKHDKHVPAYEADESSKQDFSDFKKKK